MKKLVTSLLCIVCLATFSFFKNAQRTVFNKLAVNLYEAKAVVPMSEEHKTNLKNILMKQYGIKSFNQDVVLSFKKFTDPKNPSQTGLSVAETKAGASIFTQTIVNKGVGDMQELTQRDTPIPKYTSSVASEVSSILNNYN